MKKQVPSLFALIVFATLLPATLPPTGSCASGPAPSVVTISGEDYGILKDFFARFEQERANKVPGDEVKRVLLQALPEAYREGWIEAMKRTASAADESPALTVRVLHVQGRKDERSIRALITFTLLSKTESTPAARYDERLAALVIGRDTALLSLVEPEREREEGCLVHILQEKEIRIGGRGVIGLNFRVLNDNPAGGGTLVKQETINFYLFQDNGIRFAGSVLKAREERVPEGPKGARSVYHGSIVFKKDMKGNIVGILSPYTSTEEGRQVDKGMVRYTWDTGRGAFVKE